MKRPRLRGSSEPTETDTDEQITEAVIEAIRESNDKTVEIRPADQSKGWGIGRLMLLIGGAVGAAYWLRKSEKTTEMLQNLTSETADRTQEMTGQAAETIQERGETVADRVEEGTQKAGERVQRTGEDVAEKTEEASEEVADEVDESGSSSGN